MWPVRPMRVRRGYGAGKRGAMQVLSVQSSVAYGHVGNAAATFPLQRLGHEVWPVATVNYSNHPGHGSYRGGVYHATDVAETLDEIERRGGFHRCDAVLSGFLGSPATGPVLLNAVDRIKRANPEALYVLDPVIGDAERGVYVADGIAEFFRDEALKRADIVMPNLFELEQLSGRTIRDVDTAVGAAASLLDYGPSTIVVTGVRHELRNQRAAGGRRTGLAGHDAAGRYRVLRRRRRVRRPVPGRLVRREGRARRPRPRGEFDLWGVPGDARAQAGFPGAGSGAEGNRRPDRAFCRRARPDRISGQDNRNCDGRSWILCFSPRG